VAARELLAQGATRLAFQPGGDRWLVLPDPAGHPFCLAPAEWRPGAAARAPTSGDAPIGCTAPTR
jgi:Glyoxalase-like domain